MNKTVLISIHRLKTPWIWSQWFLLPFEKHVKTRCQTMQNEVTSWSVNYDCCISCFAVSPVGHFADNWRRRKYLIHPRPLLGRFLPRISTVISDSVPVHYKIFHPDSGYCPITIESKQHGWFEKRFLQFDPEKWLKHDKNQMENQGSRTFYFSPKQ